MGGVQGELAGAGTQIQHPPRLELGDQGTEYLTAVYGLVGFWETAFLLRGGHPIVELLQLPFDSPSRLLLLPKLSAEALLGALRRVLGRAPLYACVQTQKGIETSEG
jgi:hypothetical protein